MRHARLVIAALVLGLFACSSVAPVTLPPPAPPPAPPPPPPGPGAPASIAIVSGDGQSAVPGSLLPVVLKVVVRDAAGVAVPGVAVQFAVDSGGGSIATSAATTGSDGIATAGSWTLGSVVGTQVVGASVTTIATRTRFHATALGAATQSIFNNATIAAGGGTLRYTNNGDPLDGLTLTVPAGAYTTASQWTVMADPSVHVVLPAGVTQVGPALIIGNNLGFADSAMTLTVPLNVSLNNAVVPFYYDVVSGTLEPIPLVDRTADHATLTTQHFSADLMAVPNASSGAGSLRMSFGQVRIVWATTPAANLVGTFNSGFLPGVDDWEFANYGDYIAPLGICEGMSVTAMFWHYFIKKSGGGSLYHRFDQSVAHQWDNRDGIRFAGSVQGDYDATFNAATNQIGKLYTAATAHGVILENLTSRWILLTLKVTGNPVLLSLQGTNIGHAVVAYGALSTGAHTEVFISDPNQPGVRSIRIMFESGVPTPVSFATSAGAPPDVYQRVYAVGVSAEVPTAKISQRYSQFKGSAAGADRYPHDYHFEYFDEITQGWKDLPDSLDTTNQTLRTHMTCPDCPIKAPDGTPSEPVNYWTADGSRTLSGNAMTLSTSQTLNVVGYAPTPFDPSQTLGFVDYKLLKVIYHPFELTPIDNEIAPGTSLALVAHPHGFGTANATYTWDFGDGTAGAFKTGDSTVNHIYPTEGDFTTTVVFRNGSGTVLARRTTHVLVHLPFSVSIEVTPTPVHALQVVTLIAHATGLKNIPHYFEWTFGDAVGTTKPDSTVPHAWTFPGTYLVTVKARDNRNDSVLVTGTLTVVVGTPVWRITSFSQASFTNTLVTAPINTTLAALERRYRETEWELRDSILARPGGGLIQLYSAGEVPTAMYRNPLEDSFLYSWLLPLREAPNTAAMYLSFPRGPVTLAEPLATTGLPAIVAGFGGGFAYNSFQYVNQFATSTTTPTTYTGQAATKALGSRTSNTTQQSLIMMHLEINAVTTPTGGLSGTITFVATINCSEDQAYVNLGCGVPIKGELRRVYNFTAVAQ